MTTSTAYEYEPFVAEYYDYLPPAAARPDIEFYQGFARATSGKVLELGCGTGRILIPTAAAGCPIAGLDRSAPMLARCRAKLAAQPREVQQRVRLVEASMADFHLDETFRLVTTPFRSFQHLLSVDEQLSCLRAAHRYLEPGGRLILEVFHPDPRRLHDPFYLQEREAFPEVRLPDSRSVRLAERIAAFHRAAQINDVELIYYVTHPGGRTERLVYAFPIRYFFRYEVEHLLARCGFRIVERFGNFDRSELRDDSPEMIFVAEKSESPVRA